LYFIGSFHLFALITSTRDITPIRCNTGCLITILRRDIHLSASSIFLIFPNDYFDSHLPRVRDLSLFTGMNASALHTQHSNNNDISYLDGPLDRCRNSLTG